MMLRPTIATLLVLGAFAFNADVAQRDGGNMGALDVEASMVNTNDLPVRTVMAVIVPMTTIEASIDRADMGPMPGFDRRLMGKELHELGSVMSRISVKLMMSSDKFKRAHSHTHSHNICIIAEDYYVDANYASLNFSVHPLSLNLWRCLPHKSGKAFWRN